MFKCEKLLHVHLNYEDKQKALFQTLGTFYMEKIIMIPAPSDVLVNCHLILSNSRSACEVNSEKLVVFFDRTLSSSFSCFLLMPQTLCS